MGEKDIVAILQRLDELMHDDPRTAATETLEVVHVTVHRLMQNMSVIVDGEGMHFFL